MNSSEVSIHGLDVQGGGKVLEKGIDTRRYFGMGRWVGGSKSSEDHTLGKTSLKLSFLIC